MTIFSQLHAPVLCGCDVPLVKRHVYESYMGGRASPPTTVTQRLLTGYMFAVDKSVREYRSGSATLVAYSNSANKTLLLFEGLGRFETCINAVNRAFKFLTALKACPDGPAISRPLRRMVETLEGSVSAIRNAVEHIERDIAEPQLMPDRAAHILAINREGTTLDISVHSITFRDLGATIEKLFQAGGELIDALPAPASHAANMAAIAELRLDIG